MLKRQLTPQERRSDLDIPLSAFDAWCDAWEDEDERRYFFDHWDYDSPWHEYTAPEWVSSRMVCNRQDWWRPWAECGVA